jgi:hypothetical protein
MFALAAILARRKRRRQDGRRMPDPDFNPFQYRSRIGTKLREVNGTKRLLVSWCAPTIQLVNRNYYSPDELPSTT